VNCGKTADLIWISFGVVSGVGRGIGILDGVHMPQGEGEVWGFDRIGLNGVLKCIFKLYCTAMTYGKFGPIYRT